MIITKNVAPVAIIDKHFLVKWDKNDLDSIFSLCKNIREGDNKAVKEWDLLLENKGFVTPLKIAVDEKYIATYKGISRFCQLITGQATERPAYVAVGTGTATPTPMDTALVAEMEYVAIATNGFFDASGTTIRYCGTFGAEVADNDMKESLLRDRATSSSGSTTFCRNTFTTNYIDHNEGESGFSAAGIFSFTPVA